MDALKDFDDLIVNPFIDAEKEFNDELIIAVLPDHPTPCKIRTHSADPVRFAIYNPSNKLKLSRKYSELSG